MSKELSVKENTTSVLPSQGDWAMMKEQATMLVDTGFLPNSVKTPQQAATIMLKGRELGIPAMQAFSHINIIQGKPCVSPELMTALIYRNIPTAEINFLHLDNTSCKINARRSKRDPFQVFQWTIEDAKNAGLANKDNWKKYARAMLRSRCVAEMARSIFADAIMGCSYTPEEMGANVNEEMEIIIPEKIEAPKNKVEAPKNKMDETLNEAQLKQKYIQDCRSKVVRELEKYSNERIQNLFKMTRENVIERSVDEKTVTTVFTLLKSLENNDANSGTESKN